MKEANEEDPWKEPIKDLIDEYADIAEQNKKTDEQKIIQRL